MKTYYHATSVNNQNSILANGLKVGIDGIVYMTEDEKDAFKFAAAHGVPLIVIFKIGIPNTYKNRIIETFDHNYDFFKCRAWGYTEDIPAEWIKVESYYTNPLFG